MKVLGKLDSHMQKRKKKEKKELDHYLTQYTKINSKDFNIRPKTLKFL